MIHFLEHDSDLEAFDQFLARNDKILGLDTESTGLELFGVDHQLRLVQVGNGTEAWVLRTDRFAEAARRVLLQPRIFVCHNAPFDALVIDRHLGVPLEKLLPRIYDTKILAHLVDPRGVKEGGVGLTLKALCAAHVDPQAPDTQEDLTKVFTSFGWTKRTGWARIAIDHMTYVLYAGLDAVLVSRLFEVLSTRVARTMSDLSKFEHKLQYHLTIMQRRGMLLDVPYVENLKTELLNEQDHFQDVAMDLGLDNVDSPQQVAKLLTEMGEELTERTNGGALKVDRSVLVGLADLNLQWERLGKREPNPVADAVIRAKRAGKWAEAYAQSFLDLCDSNSRLHPSIHSLQARTGRMSISTPPLQQLPSAPGEWRIRRSFIPDPGYLIIAADYQAVEMRVLAALSGDPTMKLAIAAGMDLHSFTAERVFGPAFTKQHRKIAKAVGFGKVYGGGAATISRQTGADVESVQQALAAYDSTFPGIKRYSRQLAKDAMTGTLEVVTPIGRHLPLDEDRIYAATNYVVQSTSRDLLASAILDLFTKGLGDYLLLPVHDELLGQAPAADAQEIVTEIGKIMESEFMEVDIVSSCEVVGFSWGAAYGAPTTLPTGPIARKGRRVEPGTWAQDSLDLWS
jgi:DNA polymerase-1